MGWWKSDSGSSAPLPPQQEDDSSTMMMMMMAQMMGKMMEAGSMQQPQMPPQLQMPDVQTVENIDWTERTQQLAAKTKADYASQNARRKGHADTIHTSPLLDDEEVTTTQNLIS